MTYAEVWQLKLNCLQLSAGQLEPAKELYKWVTKEVVDEEVKKAEAQQAKEALSIVK